MGSRGWLVGGYHTPEAGQGPNWRSKHECPALVVRLKVMSLKIIS